jgi:uncharacterized cupredoxin-like copper-binding protein
MAACGSSAKTTTSGSGGYGSASSPAKADRTVNVQVLPTLSYDPASISVKPGETVLFKVVNHTTGIHEFVLGDQKAQDDYEALMKSMGNQPMMMPNRPNIVDVGPGATQQLAWTFPTKKGATVIYGSHEPGDFANGLKGLVTVS